MIRSIGGRDEDLSIVSGFDRVLYDAFKNALERDQTKAWQQVMAFVQQQIIHAYGHDSAAAMQQLNWLPSALYNLSSGNQEASKLVAKDFASFFKNLSWIFESQDGQKDPISENPLRFQMFFKTLMNFYHYALHHPDELVVQEIMNKFNAIGGDEVDFDTRQELQGMTGAQEQKKAIRDKAVKKHQLMVTQRQASLTLLAWLTFLFFVEKLTEERFIFLIGRFDLRYDYFEELLADIDYIRTYEPSGYLGIGFWDYLERESGVMYSPPSAYDWILYGPALLLLRGPLPDFDPGVIVDDRQHAFLLDNMKQKLQVFKLKMDKVAGILGWAAGLATEQTITREGQLLQIYDEREGQILSMFQRIKTINEEEENKRIIAQPLDQELVDQFKTTLYNKWLANNLSYQLFKDKGAVQPVNAAEALDFHGQSILLDHQKMMFIKDNQQNIYGSEDLGSLIGRNTDERFIYDITRMATRQSLETDEGYSSVCAGLNDCIAAIRANEFEPDVIIVPSTLLYKSDLVASPKYKRINLTERSIQVGIYDGVPVMRLFAQGMNAKAIVAAFKPGFALELYQDKTLFEQVLYLELRELTTTDIDSEYKDEHAKWGTNSDGIALTEEQAKLRLQASLMLEMWSRGRFKVIDPNAVRWCRYEPAATAK